MPQPRTLLLLALVALPALLGAAPANATVYVDRESRGGRCDDTRSAAGVGATQPWCSLQRAAAATPAGETVVVRGGTYPRLQILGAARGVPVTFRAAPGERVAVAGLTLQRSSGWRFEGLVLTALTDLTSVSALAFDRNEVSLRYNGASTPSAFLVTGARNVSWTNNWIHDGHTAILTRWGGLEDITIRGNNFERMAGDGVFVRFGRRVTIEDNRFTRVAAVASVNPSAHVDAVQVVGSSEDVRLLRNVVREGRGFIVQFADAERSTPGLQHQRMVIDGNLFTGPDFAARVYSAPGIRITRNTAWGTGLSQNAGIDLRNPDGANAPTTNAVVTNNVMRRLNVEPQFGFAALSDNLVEKATLAPTGRVLDATNLLATAQFVNAAAGDYRLASGTALAGTAGVTSPVASASASRSVRTSHKGARSIGKRRARARTRSRSAAVSTSRRTNGQRFGGAGTTRKR